MVFSRSFLCSRAREAITAGTEQPKPRRSGIKALPDNPRCPIMSSMTKATLDIYPLSSKKARARNKIKILGRNVRMPPTPEMIPSTIREMSMALTWRETSPSSAKEDRLSSPISK